MNRKKNSACSEEECFSSICGGEFTVKVSVVYKQNAYNHSDLKHGTGHAWTQELTDRFLSILVSDWPSQRLMCSWPMCSRSLWLQYWDSSRLNWSCLEDFLHHSIISQVYKNILCFKQSLATRFQLQAPQNLLYVGCFEGQIPFYLTKKYGINVYGIENAIEKIHSAIEIQDKLSVDMKKKVMETKYRGQLTFLSILFVDSIRVLQLVRRNSSSWTSFRSPLESWWPISNFWFANYFESSSGSYLYIYLWI